MPETVLFKSFFKNFEKWYSWFWKHTPRYNYIIIYFAIYNTIIFIICFVGVIIICSFFDKLIFKFQKSNLSKNNTTDIRVYGSTTFNNNFTVLRSPRAIYPTRTWRPYITAKTMLGTILTRNNFETHVIIIST